MAPGAAIRPPSTGEPSDGDGRPRAWATCRHPRCERASGTGRRERPNSVGGRSLDPGRDFDRPEPAALRNDLVLLLCAEQLLQHVLALLGMEADAFVAFLRGRVVLLGWSLGLRLRLAHVAHCARYRPVNSS